MSESPFPVPRFASGGSPRAHAAADGWRSLRAEERALPAPEETNPSNTLSSHLPTSEAAVPLPGDSDDGASLPDAPFDCTATSFHSLRSGTTGDSSLLHESIAEDVVALELRSPRAAPRGEESAFLTTPLSSPPVHAGKIGSGGGGGGGGGSSSSSPPASPARKSLVVELGTAAPPPPIPPPPALPATPLWRRAATAFKADAEVDAHATATAAVVKTQPASGDIKPSGEAFPASTSLRAAMPMASSHPAPRPAPPSAAGPSLKSRIPAPGRLAKPAAAAVTVAGAGRLPTPPAGASASSSRPATAASVVLPSTAEAPDAPHTLIAAAAAAARTPAEHALVSLVESKVASLQAELARCAAEASRAAEERKAAAAVRTRLEAERNALQAERAEFRAWREAEKAAVARLKTEAAAAVERAKRTAARQARAAALAAPAGPGAADSPTTGPAADASAGLATAVAAPERALRAELAAARAEAEALRGELRAANARAKAATERARVAAAAANDRIAALLAQVEGYEAARLAALSGTVISAEVGSPRATLQGSSSSGGAGALSGSRQQPSLSQQQQQQQPRRLGYAFRHAVGGGATAALGSSASSVSSSAAAEAAHSAEGAEASTAVLGSPRSSAASLTAALDEEAVARYSRAWLEEAEEAEEEEAGVAAAESDLLAVSKLPAITTARSPDRRRAPAATPARGTAAASPAVASASRDAATSPMPSPAKAASPAAPTRSPASASPEAPVTVVANSLAAEVPAPVAWAQEDEAEAEQGATHDQSESESASDDEDEAAGPAEGAASPPDADATSTTAPTPSLRTAPPAALSWHLKQHLLRVPPPEALGAGARQAPGVALLSSSTSEDGAKTQHVYSDGSVVALFAAQGTEKETRPGGVVIIRYGNGDVKRSFPSPVQPGASVEAYYFAAASTVHTRYAGAEQPEYSVYEFPSGQVELHWGDGGAGGKEILFPDGTVKLIDAAGERSLLPDGRVVWGR